jgi:hypothetical protein
LSKGIKKWTGPALDAGHDLTRTRIELTSAASALRIASAAASPFAFASSSAPRRTNVTEPGPLRHRESPPITESTDTFESPNTTNYEALNIDSCNFVEHNRSHPRKLLQIRGTLNERPVLLLVDCGASSNFVSTEFIKNNNLGISTASTVNTVTLADGSQQASCGTLEHACITVGTYTDHFDFTVLPLPKYDAILGQSWLQSLNPNIDWIKQSISLTHDGRRHSFTATTDPMPYHATKNLLNSLLITKASLKQSIRRRDVELLILVQHTSDTTLHLSSIDQSQESDEYTEQRKALLTEFNDVFPPKLPPGLPPRREVDHKIELVPDAKPVIRPTYAMSARRTQ